MKFLIREIPKNTAFEFVKRFHYSKCFPRLTKICIGGFVGSELKGVMTLGWGTQPKATIKRIFPSLETKDYFELGKLALDDAMPRNSESEFISGCFDYLKKKHKSIKVVFTWADGMLGKPGYVYQASNFIYAGFVWTDRYQLKDGRIIHPRSARSLLDENAKEFGKKVFWLKKDFMATRSIKKIKGKQFRYVYFLVGKTERKKLVSTAKTNLNLTFPKHSDLAWFCDGKQIVNPFSSINVVSAEQYKHSQMRKLTEF